MALPCDEIGRGSPDDSRSNDDDPHVLLAVFDEPSARIDGPRARSDSQAEVSHGLKLWVGAQGETPSAPGIARPLGRSRVGLEVTLRHCDASIADGAMGASIPRLTAFQVRLGAITRARSSERSGSEHSGPDPHMPELACPIHIAISLFDSRRFGARVGQAPTRALRFELREGETPGNEVSRWTFCTWETLASAT